MIKKYREYYLKKLKKEYPDEEDRIIDNIYYTKSTKNWTVMILNYDESYREHDWAVFTNEESMIEWLEKNTVK